MQPRLVMIRFPLQEFRSPINLTNPIDPGYDYDKSHLLN
jgi:hypothetical protein